MNLDNHFLDRILKSRGGEIISYKEETANTALLDIDDSKYILKKTKSKCKRIYDFLASQRVVSVVYPVKAFREERGLYFLYRYYRTYEYPNQKKVADLLAALGELHEKTGYDKRISPNNEKFLHRAHYKLKTVFSILEMIARECEIAPNKGDKQWIILSKYSTILDSQKEILRLLNTIKDYIQQKKEAKYALNHGNPTLEHIVDQKLVSLDNAYLGIFVSDIAKLYCNCCHLNIDWFKVIDNHLSLHESPFYKAYFKFLVLYILIMNIRTSDYYEAESLNTFIQITARIKKFLTVFASY